MLTLLPGRLCTVRCLDEKRSNGETYIGIETYPQPCLYNDRDSVDLPRHIVPLRRPVERLQAVQDMR